MNERITFTLDGREVSAAPGETIWQVAKRIGRQIPHLCHKDDPEYRPDGNCRACMVEIEGERVLAASCIRKPAPGMVVRSAGARVEKSLDQHVAAARHVAQQSLNLGNRCLLHLPSFRQGHVTSGGYGGCVIFHGCSPGPQPAGFIAQIQTPSAPIGDMHRAACDSSPQSTRQSRPART